MPMPNKCKHKGYQAKRQPRTLCEACWRKWIAVQDSKAWMEWAKEELEDAKKDQAMAG